MAIAFDAPVAFDSDLYAFNGGPSGVIIPEVDKRATITSPDSRAAVRRAFRASFDRTSNAAFRE